jgi:cell division septum initiation protein DivIVA
MKAVAFLCLLCVPAMANKAEVTPVQKVLELMAGMLEKGKKEKHDEQVQYAAYKQFCDDTSVEKQRAIEEANEKIEMLKADIQKNAAKAKLLTKEIAGLDEDIAVWNGDKRAATKVRDIEKADYDATHADYSESISALERAIAVLKKQDYDRKQASGPEGEEGLLQVSALKKLSLIPADAKRAIDAFIQQVPDDSSEMLAITAPEADAYEFQSSGIIEMLEKLLDKFIEERTTLEKEEMNSKHAYDMLMQDLNAQIAQAEKDRDEKAEAKAKALEKKAEAEGDLKDTVASRDEDAKYLAELTATCEQKASDFEARQQLRAEEIEAIEKAMEIISSNTVAGNAEKHINAESVAMLQKTSFGQLRTDMNVQAQSRVAMYLHKRSKELNSRVLSALAARVADDPFTKVKKMIKDLIVRLMEEANEEAEHKGWCDTELATNEQVRKEKTEAVETLHATIDELEASIAKLTEDIKTLTEEVAELTAAMAKATKLRQEEKAKNAETIEDADEAQAATAQAITVLKEFYAKAGDATAFLQRQEPPEIFDSPYKGMQAENGGVIGMLEVIESDFARLESETKAAEATAQKEYDQFMEESKVSKAQKETDIEHKTAKKQDEEQALTTTKKDLEGTQKELDAALAYYDKLKPSCVDAGVSYEDRVARRKEEIESLQEALRILNGEDIA